MIRVLLVEFLIDCEIFSQSSGLTDNLKRNVMAEKRDSGIYNWQDFG